MDGNLIVTAILIAVTIGLWATGWLPEYLTALLFFAAATILHVAPPAVIFSGFASAAFWLVLSGYVIGIAIAKTGLAIRVAGVLATHIAASYTRMVLGVVVLTYALAFVMPSNMGRIALLMPIVLALADRAGLGEGRTGRIGLALAVGFGTYQLSASILPANVPNLLMAGAIETSYGLHLAYVPYLVLHAPVIGLLKGTVVVAAILWLFRDRTEMNGKIEPVGPLTGPEKRLAVLLALTLGLWITDSLHGIQPAWVGLAAACICLLPRIGFVTAEDFASDVSHRTMFYIAGVLGLATLAAQSGLGSLIGNAVLKVAPLEASAPFTSYATIVGFSTLLNFAVTANGVPAIFTPLAQTFATATGFPLITVLMFQVLGFATPILPYQAAPIVLAMGIGRIPLAAATRLCLVVAAVTFLVLLPLDYGWMALLGWLG
ncbi:MAG TPA: SLC13 family permease [Hyphomicrobiaceae bacterium]|nr:SLC13 family permease [Hyphomicrobiaceae bacterium]